MKKIILSVLTLAACGAQAEEAYNAVVYKSLQCQGATTAMELVVLQDNYVGSVPTVSWAIENAETQEKNQFMGYFYSDKDVTAGGLKEFRSTDLGSAVEVSGSLAVLQVEGKEEALFCKDITGYVLPY